MSNVKANTANAYVLLMSHVSLVHGVGSAHISDILTVAVPSILYTLEMTVKVSNPCRNL